MPYIAATDADRAAMLERIGVLSVEELFSDIPSTARFPVLDLPPPLSELEAMREIEALAAKNLSASSSAWFLGAGAYYHFIPAVVPALASRGEFLTAYTPYQPEVSQGTLQAIFEYQSMAAALFGMDVVNASHYDGATALAEAVLMAFNAAGGAAGAASGGARNKAILCADLHPEYKEVIRSYLRPFAARIEESDLPPEGAAALADASTFCVVAPYPGFTGAIGDIGAAAKAAHAAGALLVVHADPIMCALLKSPGELGADIVAAEGQSLGNPMSFGGPYLGMMGARSALVRKMPGRLVGQAKDAAGRRGFVLTLTAREQHIRREKAVSNICSNQGLAMLQACIYLAAMGRSRHPRGRRALLEQGALRRLAYLEAAGLRDRDGRRRSLGRPSRRWPVRRRRRERGLLQGVPRPHPRAGRGHRAKLSRRGIVPGLPLSRYYPERSHELVVCVTEMCTKSQIELLAASLAEAAE